MKKNGFTIVELITVISILSIIGIVLMPKISTAFKKTYADQAESIRTDIANATDVFLESNYGNYYNDELNKNNYIKIYLKELVDYGFIDDKIYNPNTKNYLDINKEYIEISIDDVGLKNYHFSF